MCQFKSLKIGFLQSNHLDLESKGLLIHLISKASHKDFKLESGKKVLRSQFVTSLSKLSKELDITIRRVRTLINKLEKLEEIKIESSKEGTTITVLKYDEYIATEEPKTTHTEVKESDNVSVTEIVEFTPEEITKRDEFREAIINFQATTEHSNDNITKLYNQGLRRQLRDKTKFNFEKEIFSNGLSTVFVAWSSQNYNIDKIY